MSGDPANVVESVFKALFEVGLSRFEGKGRYKQAIEVYRNARIDEYSKINRDWADAHFLLDTVEAFVPVRLVGSTGRPDDLASVISNHDRIVLQGQPGAGKSTITRYIALIMARAAVDKRRYGRLPQELLRLSPMFPLRVELSGCGAGQKVEDRILRSIDEDTPQLVQQKLEKEPILFLLDGLDEVTNAKRRNQVMDEICNLTYNYTQKGHRFVVTTRSASYSHRTLGGGGYGLYRVDELAVDQQEAMVRRYYRIWSTQSSATAAPTMWHEQANDLIDQLRNNQGLARLGSNPLLLAQICYLHFTSATLPSKRHEVYDRIIRHLVSRRDRPTPSETEHRVTLLGEIAIAMHQQQDQDWMSRETIEEILAQNHASGTSLTRPSSSLAPATVDQIEKEWGILVQRASGASAAARYAFANMSFQEYLAAYAVYRKPHQYWPALRDRLPDDRWEEVMLLYAAMPPANQQNPLKSVVEMFRTLENADSFKVLCKTGRCLASDRTPPLPWHDEVFQALRGRSYEEDESGVKALEVLCQIEPEGSDLILERVLGKSGPLDQEMIMRLLRRMDDSVARQHLRGIFMKALDERPKLSHRIHIAEALAQVGDPRLGALIDVVQMKGGRQQTLFGIGKYPVTNFEYSLFLQSTSRPQPPHWQPGGYQTGRANHPATHICLADAIAYCEWLSHKTGAQCRLPSADEWLASARAGGSDDRYPWGPHMQGEYLNFRNQFESTTPVGIYPEGENGLKIADLLGNVWEWTTSRQGNQYVLKGGAWDTMYELQDKGVHLEFCASGDVRGPSFGFRVLAE
jgi:energy-coupling factor transporter ATP-binding protein EcfA2